MMIDGSNTSVKLLYQGKIYQCLSGETILSALNRQNISLTSPCKKSKINDCQSCTMIALNKLNDKKVNQKKFSACRYIPVHDMEIALATDSNRLQLDSNVISLNQLNPNVMEVVLQCATAVDYYGGQSVSIVNSDQIAGSYPIASACSTSAQGRLEIHVHRNLGGDLSRWMFEFLKPGDALKITDINGELTHNSFKSNNSLKSGVSQQALLLAAWNGGLGALIGLIQDIFESGQTKPVLLFHGVSHTDNFYLQDELLEISQYYPNFKYIPCLEQKINSDNVQFGSINQVIQKLFKNLNDWTLYLCGDQTSVQQLQRYAYLSGARLSDIHYEVTTI